MWYMHTMGYYSFLKKKILIHSTTWMEPENIMQSKMSVTKGKIL